MAIWFPLKILKEKIGLELNKDQANKQSVLGMVLGMVLSLS